MEEERLIYSELPNIEAFMCVLGLKFPESATEFQKAFLTLAHLMASSRDFVLQRQDVPQSIVSLIGQLTTIITDERFKQQTK